MILTVTNSDKATDGVPVIVQLPATVKVAKSCTVYEAGTTPNEAHTPKSSRSFGPALRLNNS